MAKSTTPTIYIILQKTQDMYKSDSKGTNQNNTNGVALVSSLLTLNISHTPVQPLPAGYSQLKVISIVKPPKYSKQ